MRSRIFENRRSYLLGRQESVTYLGIFATGVDFKRNIDIGQIAHRPDAVRYEKS